MDNLIHTLSQRLADRHTEVHAEWTARPAAVLIPLFSPMSETGFTGTSITRIL